MDARSSAGLRSPERTARDRRSGAIVPILAIVAAGTLARLALAAAIGLGVDESYAVAVARPVSLGYFDHPPLVFWTTALVERLGGGDSDVVLRLPFILLFAATTWIMYLLAKRLFGERAALYTAALMQIIPVFGVSDGGWILPDGPLLFGFAVAGYALARTRDADGSRWWIAAGLGAGIAALSKYHAIFIIIGALLYVVTTRGARRWLARPAPYAAGGIALAMSLPVWIWNARHGWASFRFQGGRAAFDHGLHLAPFLQNLAGQTGYILPWIWIPLVWQFVAALRRGPRDESRWLLACLAAGPVVLFPLLALGGRAGLPHWPAPGFLFLVPLLGDALARLEERGRGRLARGYVAGSAALVAALLVFAATQIETGWFSRAEPALFRRGDPSLDAVDWRELRPVVDSLSRGARPLVVAADWIDGAKLGAALGNGARVLCLNDDDRQFHFAADPRDFAGRDALVVLREASSAAELPGIASRFRSVDASPVARVTIHRRGHDALALLVYRASAFMPESPRRASSQTSASRRS